MKSQLRIPQVKEQRSAALKLAGRGPVTTGLVRVATLMPVPELLRQHGVDPARVFAEFGLKSDYFDDPENTIPFATMSQFQRRCAELAHCPHWGLLTGQRDHASALGAVGFLMENSSDVRSALGELVRHHRTHNPNATVSLAEGDSFATLDYTILHAGLEQPEQILDAALALGFNLMRELCGQDWLATEVRFAYPRPRDVTPYRQFYGNTLRFDAGETALLFDRRWLDKPIVRADPLLHLMMTDRVSELESHLGDDLVGQIRRVLPALVTAGGASLAVVARHVGLGARTLNRHLAAERTSFVRLREEARYAIACQLLEGSHLLASEIADRVGYANPSAFSRAFVRWSGVAPAQWRASKRRQSSRRPRSSGQG
jgi:AraC-like DNA-binding protein